MKLMKPYEELIPTIIHWNEEKLKLWEEMRLSEPPTLAGNL